MIKYEVIWLRTISLIPVSFPVGSLGLEDGRGGGTRAPAARGVVGRFGAGTKQKKNILVRVKFMAL